MIILIALSFFKHPGVLSRPSLGVWTNEDGFLMAPDSVEEVKTVYTKSLILDFMLS